MAKQRKEQETEQGYQQATEVADIGSIKKNPNNPRIIKDDKFRKLVQSVKDFPEMLELRPIVVNKDRIILGGNMRFAACQAAGLKQVPIIVAANLTPEQEKEFILKDNISGGEWDWGMLANEWDAVKLDEWGLDIPNYEENEPETAPTVQENNYVIQIAFESDADMQIALSELISLGYNAIVK